MGTDFEGKSNFCYGLIGQPRSGLVTIISVFCSVWLFPVSFCSSVSFVFRQSVCIFVWLSIFLLSFSLSFVFLAFCRLPVLVSLFVWPFRYFCLPLWVTVCVLIFFVCLSVSQSSISLSLWSVCLFVCLIFPACPRRSNRYFRFSFSVLQFISRHFCLRPVLKKKKKKKMFNRGQPPKYWELKYFIKLLSDNS